ncbi:Fumarate reductase/succinate dehydrogenase flavoprotein-like [Crocosphaera chwakensis CCY0110]|uniref:Fumarate reductase/succinate dehydrogenase flavoprotein-like n=1 Tax=Crocosphaera chwakensis CCY0110 TaxID=391612 RepID=A3IY11_9CHRO|nr:Fumarate reductase/succinate dehydrogenase flavoprotein-like [Crocosphaera chwakensis CCY0110]
MGNAHLTVCYNLVKLVKPRIFIGNLILSNSSDIIIIGGGAAGFLAAIVCAENNPQTRITILEASAKVLKKVRISGGGRCNVTHHCFDPAQLVTYYPRGGKELRGAFTRFQPRDIINWFEKKGVPLKTESDGRVFPVTDNSETIVNCLINEVEKAKIDLKVKSEVVALKSENNQFELQLKHGETLKAKRVLLATGSSPKGYQIAKSLGHEIIKPLPSLFTFKIEDVRLQGLEGVAVDQVGLKLLGKGKKQQPQQLGSLLITHWGISGFGVLKLSAFGAKILAENNYKILLSINWLFPQTPEQVKDKLLEIKNKNNQSRQQISSFCPLPLPKRLWQRLLEFVDIDTNKNWSEVSKKDIIKLAQELSQSKYQILGKGVFKDEFVTCGGVKLKEVNFTTMESKICPNLYFAGEILDIDGVTGGFNFQSAWTTGWLAGMALSKSL